MTASHTPQTKKIMKTKRYALIAAITGFLIPQTEAALISLNTAGVNITNTANSALPLALVKYADQGSDEGPDKNNPAGVLDWLNTGGTDTPGLISGYNTITGSNLPQSPGNLFEPSLAVNSSNGFSFGNLDSRYVVAHYGGYFVAWYISTVNSNDTYTVPTSINGVTGISGLNGGGLSNIRTYIGDRPDTGGGGRVPDGGTTLVSLGVALLGLGSMRRLLATKA